MLFKVFVIYINTDMKHVDPSIIEGLYASSICVVLLVLLFYFVLVFEGNYCASLSVSIVYCTCTLPDGYSMNIR
jgi:hypothetical protein